jgi:hypothetical protein
MKRLVHPCRRIQSRPRVLFSIISVLLLHAAGQAACSYPAYNYDTSKIPAYTLPDPLTMADGVTRVTSVATWQSARRPQILQLFTSQMYGVAPGKPATMTWSVYDNTPNALGGIATRQQVTIYFNGTASGPKMDLLIYIPNSVPRPVPIFLGGNFWGNQAINADTGIRINTNYVATNGYGISFAGVGLACVKNNLATASCRGINASQWPLDTILKHGYGLATFYKGDIDPDTLTVMNSTYFKQGIYALYPALQDSGDNFCTIGAWAWAYSRALDFLETDTLVDARRVAVMGWSRLGKAAVWAGATDPRFAMVIGDASGKGGIALSKRQYGENLTHLAICNPSWFCTNFKQYVTNTPALPFDQHELASLIAPRPLFSSTAWGDSSSDPEGEFLSLLAADTVYHLFGLVGMPVTVWPSVNTSVVTGMLGYSLRPGIHDLELFDWQQYFSFADLHLTAVTATRPFTGGKILCGRIAVTRAAAGFRLTGVGNGPVSVYSLDGKLLYSDRAVNGSALIPAFRTLAIIKTPDGLLMCPAAGGR